MKIGVLGGTFNPIHHGHLINAQIIKEKYFLDKILFVPSKYPVHKNLDGNVSSEDRFDMVRLAIADNHGFDVSRVEIDRHDQSYSIITMKELIKENASSSIFLIIGIDAFNEVDTWKDYEEILKIVTFIVMNRPGFKEYNQKIVNMTKDIIFALNPLIGISSSKIRENIKNGMSIKYYVPEKVEQYILQKGLYKN